MDEITYRAALGENIRRIRKRIKLTQDVFSEKIGIELPSWSNIENGKYYPSAENLEKILKVLNITPCEIFSFESYDLKENLINEMLESMKNDEKLTRLMYRFYLSVKHTV